MYDELKEICRACSQGCIYPSECSYFDKPPLRCMRQLLSEAADAIEELARRNEQFMYTPPPSWISVEQRLPEEDESVLVVRKFLGLKGQVPPSTYVEIAYRIGDRWVADSDEYKIARSRHTDPLYWMTLPKPPKGE